VRREAEPGGSKKDLKKVTNKPGAKRAWLARRAAAFALAVSGL